MPDLVTSSRAAVVEKWELPTVAWPAGWKPIFRIPPDPSSAGLGLDWGRALEPPVHAHAMKGRPLLPLQLPGVEPSVDESLLAGGTVPNSTVPRRR